MKKQKQIRRCGTASPQISREIRPKNKSYSTIENYNEQITKIQDQADYELSNIRQNITPKRRKSFFNTCNQSGVRFNQLNFSSIRSQKNRTNGGKFQVLNTKKINQNQPSPTLKYRNKKSDFYGENNYKQVYRDYLTTLSKEKVKNDQDQSETSTEFDEKIDEFSTPKKIPSKIKDRSPQYFRFRMSELNMKTIKTEELTLNNLPIQNVKKQQPSSQYKQLFETISKNQQEQRKQTPGEVIYNHFCIKYRDYTNIKKQELIEVTGRFTKFHKQQNKIMNKMVRSGLSEQNQFRMISQFYETYQLMNGKILPKGISHSSRSSQKYTDIKNIRWKQLK